ncbi:MAG: hypothetical protein WDW38_011455 [Sanguina aurantia]
MALRCVSALVDPEILPDPVAILEQRIAEDDITLYPSAAAAPLAPSHPPPTPAHLLPTYTPMLQNSTPVPTLRLHPGLFPSSPLTATLTPFPAHPPTLPAAHLSVPVVSGLHSGSLTGQQPGFGATLHPGHPHLQSHHHIPPRLRCSLPPPHATTHSLLPPTAPPSLLPLPAAPHLVPDPAALCPISPHPHQQQQQQQQQPALASRPTPLQQQQQQQQQSLHEFFSNLLPQQQQQQHYSTHTPAPSATPPQPHSSSSPVDLSVQPHPRTQPPPHLASSLPPLPQGPSMAHSTTTQPPQLLPHRPSLVPPASSRSSTPPLCLDLSREDGGIPKVLPAGAGPPGPASGSGSGNLSRRGSLTLSLGQTTQVSLSVAVAAAITDLAAAAAAEDGCSSSGREGTAGVGAEEPQPNHHESLVRADTSAWDHNCRDGEGGLLTLGTEEMGALTAGASQATGRMCLGTLSGGMLGERTEMSYALPMLGSMTTAAVSMVAAQSPPSTSIPAEAGTPGAVMLTPATAVAAPTAVAAAAAAFVVEDNVVRLMNMLSPVAQE